MFKSLGYTPRFPGQAWLRRISFIGIATIELPFTLLAGYCPTAVFCGKF
jgi:hypothetical protein